MRLTVLTAPSAKAGTVAFEKCSTTPKYRFSGHKLSCLEVLALLAFWQEQRRLSPFTRPPLAGYLGAQYVWRRFCASNLEHGEWRKKGWGGYMVWFPRAVTSLKVAKLLGRDLLLTDTGNTAAVGFVERMQPAMNPAAFRTYTNTTLQRVRNGEVHIAGDQAARKA